MKNTWRCAEILYPGQKCRQVLIYIEVQCKRLFKAKELHLMESINAKIIKRLIAIVLRIFRT
ncbi:MAG: hypothetical protein UZ11_BCD004001318 [Bacteroidetes bacterium OLB11]|nr:MAG: hypothetical protein UZ11_BCD004001318 [Bacteroidetes bacterium OLB11]